MTMPSELSGVVTSRSSVCFSRSSEMAPVVNAGARTSTSSVSTKSSPVKSGLADLRPRARRAPTAEARRRGATGSARRVRAEYT